MKHLLRVIATVLMYWGTRSLALKFDSFAIAYLGGGYSFRIEYDN